MASSRRRQPTEFHYTLNPDQTANIYWGETYLGHIYVPYMFKCDDTTDFMRAVGSCYMKYHRAVTGGKTR